MIKRLAPDISTRIAAGEVIERPSSVAKELIENSLDAGAKTITIQTEQGGKSSFVIEDDGCGIAFEELPLAVERYATSKISEIEDLERISTLGYRGEALASVAAVSRMEIRSRAAGAEEGGLLRCEAGELTLHSRTPAKPGTRIQIEDLFFNLPARRKFLKSASAELRRIVQIINDYSLIYPQVTFRLFEEGRRILEYGGVSCVSESVERRWGSESRLFHSQSRLGGLFARLWWNPLPDSRRVTLTLFVNGRRVQDAAVRAAISAADGAAYGEWLALIELPPEDVDVNVHPTKEEVRFRRSQEVFRIIHDNAKAIFARRHSMSADSATPPPLFDIGEAQSGGGMTEGEALPAYSPNGWSYTSKRESRPFPSRASSPIENIFTPSQEDTEVRALPADKRYIGQSAGGFLIFDFPDALAIMDPHAAHERILFEEICESFKENVAAQRLTLPTEIPAAIAAEASLHEKELASLGFLMKEGMVTAVPAIRGKGHLSPTDMLRSALRGIETENDPAKRDREVWWRMARLACRDAVKLGRRFEPEEAAELLRRLECCESPYSCPHGRPTVFLIENKKLMEQFER
ncbi:MAG: DNA mismatch repair endonuclease MutL [Synergistaceae bacterium]|nr:DNA mismatch repair endonuclease MutL [Synergistaceae bacterium]